MSIRAIKSHFSHTLFSFQLILPEVVVCSGDNWYIIFYNGEIIDSSVLDFELKVVEEFLKCQPYHFNYFQGDEEQNCY